MNQVSPVPSVSDPPTSFDNNTHGLITVRKAVSPQVGKVIQDLLALSDETDLEILNNSLEAMAEQFQTELLPVAAQLTARLVRYQSVIFVYS
jgi:hypothetical protein